MVQKAGWKESPYCQRKQEQAPSHTLPCSLHPCTHSVGLLWERHEGLLEQPQLKEERRNQSHTAGMQLLQLLQELGCSTNLAEALERPSEPSALGFQGQKGLPKANILLGEKV